MRINVPTSDSHFQLQVIRNPHHTTTTAPENILTIDIQYHTPKLHEGQIMQQRLKGPYSPYYNICTRFHPSMFYIFKERLHTFPVLYHAPQIPAGMTGFHQNGTGIRRNPLEWNWNPQE